MSQRKINKAEVAELQSRIDKGILLAQQRLVAKAIHDDLSLVVRIEDTVKEVPAKEL